MNNEQKDVSRRNFLAKTTMAAGSLGVASLLTTEVSGATDNENRRPDADKVAIVTGSSRGIGAAIARRLAAQGYKVTVNCVVNRDLAKNVVREIKEKGGEAIWLQADVRDPKAVSELFDLTDKTFGGVDVVVNNAGVMKLSPFASMTDEDFDYVINTNVKGGFNVLREAARRVRDQGRIISTSSSITLLKTETYGPYAASKAALQIYSSALAKELAGRQISVNTIAPGVVNTTLFTDGKTEEQIKTFAQKTPHGRIGEPEDIAEVVSALCSSPCSWINGETIFANGGLV
ncbi:SDR family oxidoreductase [Persicitalea sp.]|uniref:SDR family oxidoreductase n=1 Tax=Persicitalea sp. TaxID=3100273 RepID=UPI0035937BE5